MGSSQSATKMFVKLAKQTTHFGWSMCRDTTTMTLFNGQGGRLGVIVAEAGGAIVAEAGDAIVAEVGDVIVAQAKFVVVRRGGDTRRRLMPWRRWLEGMISFY